MYSNKKRSISHYLRHHDLPEDVRHSLIEKMDRLEKMIQTADAPYRKKKHYYAMLDTEIRSAVDAYIGSIDADTLTVLEKLDIKEFNKSRRTNAMFSNFARGRLQQKLNITLVDEEKLKPEIGRASCAINERKTSILKLLKLFLQKEAHYERKTG